MSNFFTKVAGVSYDNEDGSSRQYAIKKFCKEGTPLILKREPQNKHGSNAISVWVYGKNLWRKGDFQIGYIASDRSTELAARIDAGWKVSAVVANVTGGGDLTYGCNIEITSEFAEPPKE